MTALAAAGVLALAPAAVVSAGPAETVALQRLLARPGAPPFVTRDPQSGALRALRGARIALERGVDAPADALRDWVLAEAPAFGLDPLVDDVRTTRRERLADGRWRIELRQYWHGLPVELATARGIVDAEGRLCFLAANFRAVALPAPSALPGITGTDAAATAARAIAAGATGERPELWVHADEHGDALAWLVRTRIADGREVRSWVDAASGALLVRDEGGAHAQGLAYLQDPAGPLAEVALPRLLPGPGLVSHAFGIDDEVHPPVTPLGPDGDYRYPPSHPSFDQVNVYWHADRFLNEFLAGLGYAGAPDSFIVRVNVALDPYVALTNGRYVYLGQPIPGLVQDVSRSQDIIYHELTHAVLFGAGVLPTGFNREAGALHEGLADYFAAAYTNDPGIAQWLYLPFPAGATRLDQPASDFHYDRYDRVGYALGAAGTVWGNGMILSSGLWDLRRAIGPSADSLVLEAITYLPESPLWSQFANAMLQADVEHHAGRFQTRIVDMFRERHIRGAVQAAIEGPLTAAPGDTASYRALPCCGSGAVGRYLWSRRSWCRGQPCSDWTDAGEGVELQARFDEDTELRLTVLTPWADTLDSAPFFVGVRPPQVEIAGPRRLAQHTLGTWSARIAAVGPVQVQWSRMWRVPLGNPSRLTLGRELEQTFAADTACDLELAVIDGLGRRVLRTWSVETFKDQPPSNRTARFSVQQFFDDGMRQGQVSFELVQGATVDAVVYDVRGRARARIWNQPMSAGVHLLRWDARALEPGLYYLRVLAGPAATVLRFAIVR
ncbi:MAG: hypothetical protein ABL977_12800 [Candidatus Eisenbacteria bacterium]